MRARASSPSCISRGITAPPGGPPWREARAGWLAHSRCTAVTAPAQRHPLGALQDPPTPHRSRGSRPRPPTIRPPGSGHQRAPVSTRAGAALLCPGPPPPWGRSPCPPHPSASVPARPAPPLSALPSSLSSHRSLRSGHRRLLSVPLSHQAESCPRAFAQPCPLYLDSSLLGCPHDWFLLSPQVSAQVSPPFGAPPPSPLPPAKGSPTSFPRTPSAFLSSLHSTSRCFFNSLVSLLCDLPPPPRSGSPDGTRTAPGM